MKASRWYGYFLLIIFFFIWSYFQPLVSLDEIWSFGFSKRLSDGLVPYKDFNVILPPLFFFLGSFFTRSLLLFRVFGSIINATIVWTTYTHSQNQGVSQRFSLILALLNTLLVSSIYFASYNTLILIALFFSYIATLYFFKHKDGKSALILGGALSLAMLIKHTVPMFIIFMLTFLLFYLMCKKTIPTSVFFYHSIGVLIPLALLLIYLIGNDAFYFFMQFTVFGIDSFAQNFMLQTEVLIILLPIMTLDTVLLHRLGRSARNHPKQLIALFYLLSSYLFAFPLIDAYHVVQVLIFHVMIIGSLLGNFHPLPYLDRILTFALLIGISTMLVTSIQESSNLTRSKIPIYRNIPISPAMEKNISDVATFIMQSEASGNDVAIIHKSAYLYLLATDDHNYILDLLLVGNTGIFSSEDIFQLIDRKDIILTNENIGNQEDIVYREYVLDNFVSSGTIGNMKIYNASE